MHDPGTYEDCLAVIAAELETARRLIAAEIAAYPTPISGCDVQFNRLLSDRARIAHAERALKRAPFVATPRLMEPGARVESR